MFGSICNAVPALVADGDCGGKTKLAIRVFQVMTGIFPPDGKISPGGPTFKKLSGPMTLSPTMSALAALQKAKEERDATQKKIELVEDEITIVRRRRNIHIAGSAVHFARSQLSYGAGNKLEDIWNTFGESNLRTLFGRAGDLFNDEYQFRDTVYKSAVSAMTVRAGNCYEHAAVALMYLNDRNFKPIEMMEFKKADHVFVVIGRPKDSDPNDPATWGPTPAICDAWANRYYNVDLFEDQMWRWGGSASGLKVKLRID